jgi:membrane protein DedA with SNARE-associated domain
MERARPPIGAVGTNGSNAHVLSGISDWVTNVVETLGYVGVAALIALENVFPPLPSELILPLAGFETGRGQFNYFLMVLAATVGSVIGAVILYYVAHLVGEQRIRTLIRRYGKWLQITEKDLDKANNWFDRHGNLAVLVCRCVPLVRSVVSLPAGLRRMPMPQFLLFTAIGSAIWNAALIGAGWALGDNWEVVGKYVGYFQYVVIAVVGAAVIWFLWRRLTNRPNSATPRNGL